MTMFRPDSTYSRSRCDVLWVEAGHRLYDWALIGTTDVVERSGRTHDVPIRRSRNEKKELAFYLTYSPKPATLAELVTVAGRR
jgi:hypothetical protein